VNRELDGGAPPPRAAAWLEAFDQVMGVLDILPQAPGVDAELAAWVESQIVARQQARKAGDFAAADAIRAQVGARGIELEDTPGGTRWRRRPA
jgi:cysteinyl-tRNA synthetase